MVVGIMKTFKIVWYIGSIINNRQQILDSKIVQAKTIDDIDACQILPDDVKQKIPYIRITHINDTLRTIDYGNYSKFLAIETIEGD